jgi:uncharacterized protein (UPF0548 family)
MARSKEGRIPHGHQHERKRTEEIFKGEASYENY